MTVSLTLRPNPRHKTGRTFLSISGSGQAAPSNSTASLSAGSAREEWNAVDGAMLEGEEKERERRSK